MTQPIVRRATADDAETLLALIDALADYERLARPTADARERLIRDGFGPEPRFRALLGLVDGRAAGYAVCYHTYSTFLARPRMFLEDLFVLPDYRGRSVGSALFRAVARQALEDGCGRMEWMVLTWNRLAMDFYDRAGASPLSDWQPYRLEGPALEAAGSRS